MSTLSGEALDERMSPLCIMPMESILAQKLPHHAVAVLTHDSAGSLLLNCGKILEATAFGHAPAGMAREEYAENLLQKNLGHCPPLQKLGILPPFTGSDGAYVTVFLARFSPGLLAALANADFTLIHKNDLPGLLDLCGPVLQTILREMKHKAFA